MRWSSVACAGGGGTGADSGAGGGIGGFADGGGGGGANGFAGLQQEFARRKSHKIAHLVQSAFCMMDTLWLLQLLVQAEAALQKAPVSGVV